LRSRSSSRKGKRLKTRGQGLANRPWPLFFLAPGLYSLPLSTLFVVAHDQAVATDGVAAVLIKRHRKQVRRRRAVLLDPVGAAVIGADDATAVADHPAGLLIHEADAEQRLGDLQGHALPGRAAILRAQ